VNEEIKDLFAAGADIVQIDEPYMQARPDKAAEIGIRALNRALEGVTGPTAVHLCFGYAQLVGDNKPTAYSFLPQLADTTAQQISIEAAQPKLDLGILRDLAGKTVMLGVISLADPAVETPAVVAERLRAGLKYLPPDRLIAAPDCGLKYLPRETAFGKLTSLSAGARMVRGELA